VSRSSEHQPERGRDERRKEQRHRLILRVGVLEQGQTSSFCLVKNISASGVHLKTYVRPAVDAEAALRVADEPPVRGRIAWEKGDLAGMTFSEELDTETLLRVQQKLIQTRRRSTPRVNVDASATLRTGGQTSRALVCDISSFGTRLKTGAVVAPGARAVVDFPGLPSVNAFVRWNDGQESGLVFETPIPIQIIAQWIGGRIRLAV
jgi:hypothetical protein